MHDDEVTIESLLDLGEKLAGALRAAENLEIGENPTEEERTKFVASLAMGLITYLEHQGPIATLMFLARMTMFSYKPPDGSKETAQELADYAASVALSSVNEHLSMSLDLDEKERMGMAIELMQAAVAKDVFNYNGLTPQRG